MIRYVILIYCNYCICILTENPFEMFEMQRNKSAKLQVLKNEKPISMSLYINWYLQFYILSYFQYKSFPSTESSMNDQYRNGIGNSNGEIYSTTAVHYFTKYYYGLLSEQLNDSVEFGARRCYLYPDGSVLRPSTSLYFYYCVVVWRPIWLHGGSTKFTGCPVHTK